MNPDNTNPFSTPQPPQSPQQVPPASPQPNAEYIPRYVVPPIENVPPKSSVAYPWVPVTGPDTSQFSGSPDRQTTLSEPSKAPAKPFKPTQANAPGQFPQYGDPMAFLPPLGGQSQTQASAPVAQPLPASPRPPQTTKRDLHKWIVAALLTVGILFSVVLVVLLAAHSHKTNKAPTVATQQAVKPVVYNNATVAELIKSNKLNAAAVAKLDKTNTFYSIFRTAAQQPLAHTKWDVYYTKKQNDKRGSEFTLYDVAANYTTKAYTYSEDDYRKIGTWQSRCIGAKQYIFDASKSTTAAQAWHPASDDSNCALPSVATRMSDGLNTGGLSAAQSDTFIQYMNKTGAVRVNSLKLVSGKMPVLKFEVSVTPKRSKDGSYKGTQIFADALRAAGVDVSEQPYSYFGASGEGVQLTYYADPVSMLPLYSTMVSTPAYDKAGKSINPGTWSHRVIEYEFPLSMPALTLDGHNPIAFSSWPDH